MEKQKLVKPDRINKASKQCLKVLSELDRILLGRKKLHEMILIGLLSKGHILLEGVPGVGKTALVKALGTLLVLDFNRVQFTPDLMPSDILGMHVLQQSVQGKREMLFQSGPVFTNILLADEINRASPKTQSAMLEAMQEGCVTLLGETRPIQQPFFVLASQNPIELKGTYPLPEAQLDRFLFKLQVKNVEPEILENIISTRRRGELPSPEQVIEKEELDELFEIMDLIYLPRPVARYISRIVTGTHPESSRACESVRNYTSYGASPRAAIAISESARAHALINGRPTAGFEDVDRVVDAVLNHRIILNYKARFDNITTSGIIADLVSHTDETDLDLPNDIST